MPLKTALLIDGGYYSKAIGKQLTPSVLWPDARTVYGNARALIAPDELLFRIFYYDSEPFGGTMTNPVSGGVVDCGSSGPAVARRRFFDELGLMEYVALRRGQVKPRDWELTADYVRRQRCGQLSIPSAADFRPVFEQKGVDMRIGMDVASLALKRLVDRIVLCSGDTDMIPAMKLARREGLQVVLAQIGSWQPHKELVEDADLLRSITPRAFP